MCTMAFLSPVLAEEGTQETPQQSEDTGAVDIKSEAYVLMEASTGTVILEKNADQPMPCANVMKSYFMLLFLEALDEGKATVEDEVTISKRASSVGGSTVFLDYNETYKVGDLFKAVVINSANDAIIALAEKLYGGEEAFIARLNERAGELGLTGTKVVNLTGTDAEGQTTTARDMAIICRELVKYPLFFQWSNTWLDNFNHPGGRVTEIVNLNKMIRNYEGCDGIKTGSSTQAGQCLSSTAKRGNARYIYVGLNAADSATRFNDAKNAFDYAFANYSIKNILNENQTIKENIQVTRGAGTVSGQAGKALSLLLKKGQDTDITTEIQLDEKIEAPIAKGQPIGKVLVKLNGKDLESVEIVAETDVPEMGYSDSLFKILYDWLN